MPSEVLYLRSSTLHYGLPSNEEPYSQRRGQLIVRELYAPCMDSGFPPWIQDYQVIIEAEVSSREEARKVKFAAFELAQELDRSWVYVCGQPLHPRHPQFQFLDAPEGWETNAREVDVSLASAESSPYATLSSKPMHWIQMPFLPLHEALAISKALNMASDATVALADLHYESLKSRDSKGRLFLLAKALEIGDRLLPGKKKASREKALPENVRSALSHSLDWLFDMSNNRFDVRHVIRKDPVGPRLHPRMTAKERTAFTHDADLVVNSIVCQQIGRAPVVSRQE